MVELKGRSGGMGEVADVVGPYEVAPFGNTLAELGATNPDIVGITADMGRYSDILPFREAFPDRYFNAGMAEQNTIMIAAGLAKVGKVSFAATYAAFLTRRALDFMAVACAHSKANVKVMGGAPGLVNPYGGTHQALEDLAVMRSIPDITVIDPCDAVELRQVVTAAASTPGTFYIRNLRGKVPVVLDRNYEFEIGKAKVLRRGSDVGIVSTGFMTARARDAARLAETQGVSVGVLHVPTIKPFDVEGVVEFASEVPRLITVENHLRTGGLGTLVLESLYDSGIDHRPVVRIGLQDRFHPCGSQTYLDAMFGLDVDAITEAAVTGRWDH